ncbi:hypothetical protein M3638_03070 [Oceanobacillus profundus]|uniref:hypothetical protein n=1 Tax=Oceanobacillus profundus TaxID=372463 RepID=UPI00203C23BE|nr:hypothetical protein [Oceanobacillus profundus]MCM3396821.1 hypothetical protein [Oceanobacillus profundus]
MLKDHYLIEDYPEMVDQIENLFNASMKSVEMAEKADFNTKHEILADMNRSLEILQALNRRKINQDVDNGARELIRRNYF